MKSKVAVLYQAAPPPVKDGIRKPMKEGGYADSGADIAYALGDVITPVANPSLDNDLDWVFPDDKTGIEQALAKGADTLWLNTVLFTGHPISSFSGIRVVGQQPDDVDKYDDKWFTNELLRKAGLPVPPAELLTYEKTHSLISFPKVLKPIRGRGSQGVTLVRDQQTYDQTLSEMFASDKYGTAIYVEPYLPGDEVTVTVMPPGTYEINGSEINKETYWCLPAVLRFNHQDGIAPYNGVVAVTLNSKVIDDSQEASFETLYHQCTVAAAITGAKAPIRIDCRQDADGNYFLFDLNMKPNMTGPSRPHRQDQDSLTALAARKIGWDFSALLANMLRQAWVL